VTTVRLATFLLTYALIAIQQFPGLRINRPAASLLGAVAMVVVARRAAGSLGGNVWRDASVVSAVMVVLSNLVSNVPAVLLWLPVVPRVPHAELMWLIIAMSSTFAGNFTLLGSMANLGLWPNVWPRAGSGCASGTIFWWEFPRPC
jgi:Na+/H+ antiporter NhaD/arsenite permease-like protein